VNPAEPHFHPAAGGEPISRRSFFGRSAAYAGAAVLSAGATLAAEKKTATDKVPLGKKGFKVSRLGIGTGSKGGSIQRNLGQEGFTRLIRHAYDRGVTLIDTADMYETHPMVREAIKGLPRESLWIQTKMMWDRPGVPEKPLAELERFRKELGVDYVDSLLIHCATKNSWHQDLKRMMDAYDEAQEKKLIRMKGVSCHGLPALARATEVDWVEVQLARVNPQGRHVDGEKGAWGEPGNVKNAFENLKAMHDKGRGIIGMKIIGDGDFKNAEDREKSVRFAMTCGFVDAVVIGMASPAEVDEAIERMNRALAENA
jgi:predicted aldo/keto reductase-like oxidoreductase